MKQEFPIEIEGWVSVEPPFTSGIRHNFAHDENFILFTSNKPIESKTAILPTGPYKKVKITLELIDED